jgi:hypothetical protein
MATVSEQLEAMRDIRENWDGYHAAAPCTSAIDLARDLVHLFEAVRQGARALPLHVGPTPPGGVLIDWEDDQTEHEIDINPDGSIEFLHMNKATKQIRTRKFSPGQRVVVESGLLQELEHLLAARSVEGFMDEKRGSRGFCDSWRNPRAGFCVSSRNLLRMTLAIRKSSPIHAVST